MIVPILIIVIVVSVLLLIVTVVKRPSKNSDSQNNGDGAGGNSANSKKNRNAIVRDAEKKISRNPHDVNALTALGEIYFGEKNWEKTWGVYKTLFDIAAAHVEINMCQAALRMGIAAYYLQRIDDAVSPLMFAMKKDPTSYETAYYLGFSLYKKGEYDKAIYCLKRAYDINSTNSAIFEPLGFSYFKLQKYREALPFLKRTLDVQPNNKEAMFDMAVSMNTIGMSDKALKIFLHLRPDPEFGAQSCLEAGRIHEKTKSFDAAIQDYEIGMKLTPVPDQTMLQIKYRCASTYFAQNNIQKGLAILKQIQAVHSNYKDVEALIERYGELNQNSNLQTYLMSGTSDFVGLCRKFIQAYYPSLFVKVEDVSVAAEHVEILCTVETTKMTTKELFRFYRSTAAMGDIFVRDFHEKIRDLKCDKGYCVTAGAFSESGHKFIEGRPIDLIEKDMLTKILKKVTTL